MIKRKRSYKVVLAASVGLLAVAGVLGAVKALDTRAEENDGSKTTARATKYWVSGKSEPGAAGGVPVKAS